MSCLWIRRALLALASASALLTVACGSGDIESQLQPSRVVVFGGGHSDMGQGGSKYTVNDGSLNIWSHHVARSYGLDLAPVVAGGTSFATGNARISAKPDAAGNSATPTVTEQISAFLAGGPLRENELLMVEGGTADVIAEMAKVTAGTQTPEQMVAAVKQAGRDMAAQVRRLVDAGATHVVAVGTYDIGRSPWAAGIGQTALLSEASLRFNDELLVAMVDLGRNVLYVDAAFLYNLMISEPTSYGMQNAIHAVCTSVDPGPGIGTGTGQVNSARCSPATVLPGADYNQYLFADRVYPGPTAQRQFGTYAFDRIHNRW
jgi:phospholipase/lecithinase/hemolysin